MTKRRVWRYKCDFCKKSGCSGGHIARHERSCTANPNRICRMHAHTGEVQPALPTLIDLVRANIVGSDGTAATGKLREACHSCPVCMLSALRQGGFLKIDIDEDGINSINFEFDFKLECASFWKDVNEEAASHENYR